MDQQIAFTLGQPCCNLLADGAAGFGYQRLFSFQ